MTEAKFQTKFLLWAKHNTKQSTVFELKIEKGNSMSFSKVLPHQERNLLIAKHRVLTYKIPDIGIAQKPFDCFVFTKCEAYLVIQFYKRGVKHFYMIDIDDYLHYKETSGRKSITENDAKSIASLVGELI